MKCALPIDQCARRPRAPHAGNCPPTSVSLRTGTLALAGSATDTTGVSPPTWGTVSV